MSNPAKNVTGRRKKDDWGRFYENSGRWDMKSRHRRNRPEAARVSLSLSPRRA